VWWVPARVIDQTVKAVIFANGLLDELPHFVHVGHIAGKEGRFAWSTRIQSGS